MHQQPASKVNFLWGKHCLKNNMPELLHFWQILMLLLPPLLFMCSSSQLAFVTNESDQSASIKIEINQSIRVQREQNNGIFGRIMTRFASDLRHPNENQSLLIMYSLSLKWITDLMQCNKAQFLRTDESFKFFSTTCLLNLSLKHMSIFKKNMTMSQKHDDLRT